MEPITDLICLILEILEFVVWGILMLIFAIITGLAGFIFIGMIWNWPIFICTGIGLILHNLFSLILFPLCVTFPFLYIMPNMCLSFLNNAVVPGLLPLFLTEIMIIPGVIYMIIQVIVYFILLLACNSNGISLLSKISQTILSWISA